jgi:translocator protein
MTRWRHAGLHVAPGTTLSRSGSSQALGLVGWLLACFGAAAVGAVASAGAGDFYAQLARPRWAPPGWLFGPVWTILYVLMAVAAWLVWRTHGFREGRIALALFVVQLGANALWTWLFFVWHRGALAFAEVVVLCCLIVATFAAFWRFDRLAAALLVPYLAWVTFAVALTFSVWQRNPGLL